MKSIIIRGIDPETERALKKASEKSGRSMNATIIAVIKEALGLNKRHRRQLHHELDHLSGTWDDSDFEEFEKCVGAFEQIDEGLWR